MALGERLKAIADLIPFGATVADIGTDHAYLPVELVLSGRVHGVIAGEVNKGPWQAAYETVSSMGLNNEISIRLGNGLAVLKPSEVDTIVIAGMGGLLMIEIMAAGFQVLSTAKRIILQPMVAAEAVRHWLLAHQWVIVEESLVKEEGKLYQIIAAEQGISTRIESILYDIGPQLWLQRPLLLREHIEQLISQLTRVVSQMSASETAVLSAKYKNYVRKIELLEDKLQCL